MSNKFNRLAAKLTTAAMLVAALAPVTPVSAGAVGPVYDTMTRQMISTASNHTITFTLDGAVANASTITITFAAAFDTTGIIEDDVDVSGSTLGEAETAADCSGADEIGIAMAADVLTLELCTGDGASFADNEVVTVEIGTNATYDGTGANQIDNPGSASSPSISFGGTGGVTGTFYVTIVDSDQVRVTAQVDPSLYFDIDVATAHGDSDPSGGYYSVPLGLITTTDTRVSGTTDSVNYIFLDYYTNAVGGMSVTVKNANGSSGLVSVSVPGDTIPNAAAAVSDGTANYGLCVVTATSASGADPDGGSYAEGTNCSANTEGNTVRALSSSTPESIMSASGPLTDGSTQIAVQAAISALTKAHNDYQDTLTFVSSATF